MRYRSLSLPDLAVSNLTFVDNESPCCAEYMESILGRCRQCMNLSSMPAEAHDADCAQSVLRFLVR